MRYAIGLADLDPKLMCEADVDELRDEEAAYLAGDFQTSRPVWSIEIVRRIGDAAAVDVSPHRAAATSSTRIALPAPRPRRVSLGGVEL